MTATSMALDQDGAVADPPHRGRRHVGERGRPDGRLRAPSMTARPPSSSTSAGLEYMNSGGIGLLVTLLVRAQRGGVRLLATGLSDHYRQILALDPPRRGDRDPRRRRRRPSRPRRS